MRPRMLDHDIPCREVPECAAIDRSERTVARLGADMGKEPCDTVRLTFEARCKSRLLLRLDSGETAALIVERGRLLRGGDRVRTEDGRDVEIIAMEESLLEAGSDDPVALAKAAYHLGNRHVAVQVTSNRLRFLNDHVLGEMVKGLGLQVTPVLAVFEPEGGAYGHHHAHGSQTPLARPKIHEFPSS